MFEKGPNGDYVHNCLIKARGGQCGALFRQNQDGTLTTRLNGYAVIPLEEYCELTGEPQEERLAAIPVAAKELDDGEHLCSTEGKCIFCGTSPPDDFDES